MSKKKKKKKELTSHAKRIKVISALNKANNETIVIDESKDTSVSFFNIDVIKKVQKGVVYYSGELDLNQLASLTHVDNYNGDQADIPGKGQRPLSEVRGGKFRDFIADNDNVCFLEILLNDRNGEFAEFTSLKDMGIKIKQHAKLAATHGILRVPIDAKFFTYDGQTRRFGYLSLLHFDLDMLGTEAYKDYKHMKVPFCLCQVSPTEETKLFLQHNKQTTVSNDHKAIVTYHTHKDMVDIKHHTATEKIQTIIAGMIYHMDRERTNPFYHNICQTDLPSEENKKRLATQGGFNTGLGKFIGWMSKNYWSPETTIGEKSLDLVDIVTTFWGAVKKTCPKIWRNPDNYIQQKPKGVSTLCMLLHVLYIDFYERNLDWDIYTISLFLKKSKIITTPKKWENGGELNDRGGSYKALEDVQRDIYDQIRKN